MATSNGDEEILMTPLRIMKDLGVFIDLISVNFHLDAEMVPN